MSLQFKDADLRPVLAAAIAHQCHLVLVKGKGVYFFSEHEERVSDNHVKLLAYAVGCNRNTAPSDDWRELARTELGDDDFSWLFGPKHKVFAHILSSTDDLMLSVSGHLLILTPIPLE